MNKDLPFNDSSSSFYFKTEIQLTKWLTENLNIFEPFFPSLRLVDTEKNLAYGRADLWCQTNDGYLVVIEAQLGKADADHICRLVSYTINSKAHVGVLICESLLSPEAELMQALNQSNLKLWVFKVNMITQSLKVLSSPNSTHRETELAENEHPYNVFLYVVNNKLYYPELTLEKNQDYIDLLWDILLLVRIERQQNFCVLTTFVKPSPHIHEAVAFRCFGSENIQNFEKSYLGMAKITIRETTVNQVLNYLEQLSSSMHDD